MAPIKKDIIVPNEILGLFKNSVRIIDKWQLSGMWPVDPLQLIKLQKMLPELLGQESILKKYDLAIEYKGKAMKDDFAKIGINMEEKRTVLKIQTQGIIVPWQLIKKAGIDHQKFNFILTPKM